MDRSPGCDIISIGRARIAGDHLNFRKTNRGKRQPDRAREQAFSGFRQPFVNQAEMRLQPVFRRLWREGPHLIRKPRQFRGVFKIDKQRLRKSRAESNTVHMQLDDADAAGSLCQKGFRAVGYCRMSGVQRHVRLEHWRVEYRAKVTDHLVEELFLRLGRN